jgi:branched-chain amino acid aminotransferase
MLISFVNFILQEGLAPINLIIEDNFHRAAPGGTGGVKTIGNYASVTFCMNISESYIFHRLNFATCNFWGIIYFITAFTTMFLAIICLDLRLMSFCFLNAQYFYRGHMVVVLQMTKSTSAL